MATMEKDGKKWVAWKTPEFSQLCKDAGVDQERINEAMKRGQLDAIEEEGVWYYEVSGLDKHFPIPGKSWAF